MVFILIFFMSTLMLVAFIILIERNIMGLSQERKGPNIVGLWGVVQTILDGFKLILKKMYFPFLKKNFFFFMGPLLAILISFLMWLFIPLPLFFFYSNSTSMFFFFFLGSIHIFSILWSGWGSSTSYSTMGSIRCVAQMISYEVLLIFCFLLLLYNFNMLNFMVVYYMNMKKFFFFFFIFFFWMLITLAENNRTPFDLIEGESELVGGYNVEYSGSFFTLLFLSEYMSIWIYSILGGFFFFSFCLLGVFFFLTMLLMIRFVLPRFKYADLISLCWFSLLPILMLLFICFYM
uniref:NADH-ubiquinone oxidoreductase chain 1 n=1 Tax=Lissoclinum patella TaxID=13110 RepID=A0A059V9B8_9ASCI|nr:NADH dehydrogenase subunit 1 [Lissoclinum patella]